jgi:hypothetical protein
MKNNGVANGTIGLASTPRFQICILLNDLSPFKVPRDSTTSAGLPAGWLNLMEQITEVKIPLFSEQNTVRIIKFGG